MQIVIEIDEKRYKDILRIADVQLGNKHFKTAEQIIAKGTPLPKGHGRLIDADKTALLSDLFCYTKYTGIDEAPYEDATKALEFAPTIIEADGAESEE